MNDTRRELRRQLRSWDPARRLGEPAPRAVEEMREALTRGRRRQRFTLFTVAALTAALLALLFVVPGDPPLPPPAGASPRPLAIEFTASNGVRIHWSVYPDSPRRVNSPESEERHESSR